MTKTMTCPVCGVEFEPFLKRQTCCCVEHQTQRRKELSKLYTGRYRARHRIRPDDLDWANARIEMMLAGSNVVDAAMARLKEESGKNLCLERELEEAREELDETRKELEAARARLEALPAKPVEKPARPAPTLKAPTPEEPGYDLVCDECGKVFWSRNRDERYCCADCLLRARKREAGDAKGYPAKKKRRAA